MSQETRIAHAAAPRGGVVEDKGRRIAWRSLGQGDVALVFIHGWCGSQAVWRHQVAAFAPRFRCVSLDLAGHGDTAPTASPPSIADLAADVNLVRAALDLDRVLLVGHSLGGPVAVEAAIASPRGVLGIVGVDTFTDARIASRRPAGEIAERLAALDADLAGSIEALVRMITLVDRTDSGLVDALTASMARVPAPIALAAMRALLEWDIDARWPLLGVPSRTLNSRALLPLILELPERDGLEVTLLDEVGHFPMLEDPARFDAALQRAIDASVAP